MSNLLTLLVVAPLAALVAGLPAASGQNLEADSHSVLRVTSADCAGGGGQTATAFVWGDRATAVTALHAVAGCRNIKVFYQSGGPSVATLTKVYRHGDLALLSIQQPQPATPFQEATHPATLQEELQVLGYALQTPTMSSTSLHLRFGGHTLHDIVPSAVATELAAVGSPSLDQEITNIEGHLLPGLSGAPVLDKQNHVVAVSDGGLENGFVGISWGIPVQYLKQLAASTESVTHQPPGHAKQLFAAETESTRGEDLSCGGLPLTKIRTVGYTAIAPSTDAPAGLMQLINYFSVDPSPFLYDVYQNLESGATIAIPATANGHSGSDGCTFDHPAVPDLLIRVQLARVNGQAEIVKVADRQEAVAAGGSPRNWYSDNNFTNATATTRSDGLLLRRRAYMHVAGVSFGVPNPMSQDAYLFETMATRNGVEMNASVLNRHNTVEENQRATYCRTMSALPICSATNNKTAGWIKSVIGIHLSTFPIG